MSTSENRNNSGLLNPGNARYNGQEKVNAEIFTAIEILGRKLERTEAERNRLADRLGMIESAATLDEQTGKIYLPAVISKSSSEKKKNDFRSNLMIATSMVSCVFAASAFAIVLLQSGSLNIEKLSNLAKAYEIGQLTPREKTVMPVSDAKTSTQKSSDETAQAGEEEDAQAEEVVDASQYETTAPDANGKVVIDEKGNVASSQAASSATTPVKDNVEVAKTVEAQKPIENIAHTDEEVSDESQLKDDESKDTASATEVKQDKPAAAPTANANVKKEEPAAAAVKADNKKIETAKKADSETPYPSDENLKGTMKQLEQAAYKGVPEAQHDLGVYYAEGQLVDKDLGRAVYWLKKAAFNGVPNAAYNLAVMYQQGLGVEKNLSEAINFYGYAVELGHAEALYNLGIMYFEGQGTPKDVNKGISYFQRAAQKGVVEASYNLGVLYENGVMGKADNEEAVKWYRQAARSGYAKANDALKRLDASSVTKAEQPESGSSNPN